jgi:8-oxo-dGTP diphosphatase
MTEFVSVSDLGGNTEQVNINDLQWRPSAYGIVIKDKKILLSPQFKGYDLPGGGVELGEDPSDAVIREVKEETGLDVADPRIIEVKSNFFKLPGSGKNVHSLLMYFACDFVGGTISTDGFDDYEKEYARAAEWVELARLWDLPRRNVASSIDWRPIVDAAVRLGQ